MSDTPLFLLPGRNDETGAHFSNHTDKHWTHLPLTFANVGLVLFIIAGIFYVEKEWDRFSLLCVLGYISIFAGLLLPELCFVEEVSTMSSFERDRR